MTDLANEIAGAVDAIVDAASFLGMDDYRESDMEHVREARARLDALLAEVVRDAERYRWMREPPDNTQDHVVHNLLVREQLDAAIDAARAAETFDKRQGEGE
jgi:hypothetical protein